MKKMHYTNLKKKEVKLMFLIFQYWNLYRCKVSLSFKIRASINIMNKFLEDLVRGGVVTLDCNAGSLCESHLFSKRMGSPSLYEISWIAFPKKQCHNITMHITPAHCVRSGGGAATPSPSAPNPVRPPPLTGRGEVPLNHGNLSRMKKENDKFVFLMQ